MKNSMFKVAPLAIAAAVALAACGKKEEAPAPKAEPAKAAAPRLPKSSRSATWLR